MECGECHGNAAFATASCLVPRLLVKTVRFASFFRAPLYPGRPTSHGRDKNAFSTPLPSETFFSLLVGGRCLPDFLFCHDSRLGPTFRSSPKVHDSDSTSGVRNNIRWLNSMGFMYVSWVPRTGDDSPVKSLGSNERLPPSRAFQKSRISSTEEPRGKTVKINQGQNGVKMLGFPRTTPPVVS